jgi:hypothetical protein
VPPTVTVAVAGVTAMVVGTSEVTDTVAKPLALPLVAVTVAVPPAVPVTVVVAPVGVTVTFPSAAAVHVTAAFGIT